MSAIKTYNYTVRSYHTDAAGRLFVHQLFNFLQDAAHKHADGLGFGQQQLVTENLFWVLSRLSISIAGLPGQGDELVLSTWVKSVRGAISEREFLLTGNDQVLVRASSLWFCLAGDSHKPVRLPAHYARLMNIHAEYATGNGTRKVARPETPIAPGKGMPVVARYADIDMVDHINNATYVRWLMDEVAGSNQVQGIKSLHINYLDEGFLGDGFRVAHTITSPGTLVHEVFRERPDKVICRAMTTWQK